MMEFWLIVVALFLGFRLLSTGVAIVNRITDIRIQPATNKPEPNLVSILIPARNEENNLPDLLEELLNSGSVVKEILVLDDHSTDQTAEIIKRYTQKDTRFRLIKGKPLPPGWLGKNFACHQLAEEATGSVLVFMDADVRPLPGAIEASVTRLLERNSGFLSVFPYQITLSFTEWSVVGLMKHILLSLLPLPLVAKSRQPSLAAANGQWMVFRTEIYRKHGFHEMVRSFIAEDIEIARLVKRLGYSMEYLVSDGLIQCRMYGSGREALKGFTKNIRQMLGGSTVSAIILTIFMTGSIPVLLFSPWPWLILVDWGLLIATRYAINGTSGRRTGMEIVEIPVLMVVQLILLMKSLFTPGKDLLWKNRPLITGS